MRLQLQAPSRGNLNAGLDSLTAIGAQLPSNTLLHPIAPVGERLRAPVRNPIVKTILGLEVLASGAKVLTHALRGSIFTRSRFTLSNRYACLRRIGASINQSITQPHLDRRGENHKPCCEAKVSQST